MFIHSLVWVVSSLWLLGIKLLWIFAAKSLFSIPGNGIAGLYDMYLINFIRNCLTVFQNGCITVHLFPWAIYERYHCSTSMPKRHCQSFFDHFTYSSSMWWFCISWWFSISWWFCVFLISYETNLLTFTYFFLVKYLFKPYAYSFYCIVWNFITESHDYLFWIRDFHPDICFENIFYDCVLLYFWVFVEEQNFKFWISPIYQYFLLCFVFFVFCERDLWLTKCHNNIFCFLPEVLFKSYIWVYDSFQLNFSMWYKVKPISFYFKRWISSCGNYLHSLNYLTAFVES